MESIIGKKYIPKDSSYCVNITKGKEDHEVHLAGTSSPVDITLHREEGFMENTPAKVCTILTNPFTCITELSTTKKSKEHEFIIVSYNNQTFSVLYYPECVQNQ
jgi:hypothetical protein